MATIAQKLTFAEFEAQYGSSNKDYEYWYGEAIPKSMPTWLHGKLQRIISNLLFEAGFESATEVELRIVSEAHPKPDVIAFREEPTGRYPSQPPDVIVEIISPDDKVSVIREHCQRYEEWGCKEIYLVYPDEQRVVLWNKGSEIVNEHLANSIPVRKIWDELGRKPSK